MSPYTVPLTTQLFTQLGCTAKLLPKCLCAKQGGSLYHIQNDLCYDPAGTYPQTTAQEVDTITTMHIMAMFPGLSMNDLSNFLINMYTKNTDIYNNTISSNC